MWFLLRSIQLRGMLQQCKKNFGRSSEHSCGESLLNSDAGRGQACLSLSSSVPSNTKSCHLWRQVAYNRISDGYFTTALKYKSRLGVFQFVFASFSYFNLMYVCLCVKVNIPEKKKKINFGGQPQRVTLHLWWISTHMEMSCPANKQITESITQPCWWRYYNCCCSITCMNVKNL